MNPLLDPKARLVVAHRGNQALHPENTVPALASAVELGADAVEFDVRMTADGVPVVLHDPDLDRTTDRRGPLRSLTLGELREVNAAARMPGHPATPVPTLEEVLDRFRSVPMVIEVKEVGAVEATEGMIRRFAATERVVVGSSYDVVTERLYRTGLAACASSLDAFRLLPAAVLGMRPGRGRFQVLSLTPVHHGIPVPVRLLSAAAGRAGIPVHVWTINDPRLAVEYWAAGVSAILTDFPSAILGARPH